MPTAEAIIWAAIASLIVIMLGIIGYLISNGFTGLKAELQKLWDKIDAHQTQAEANKLEIAAMKARCDERHTNHKRADD